MDNYKRLANNIRSCTPSGRMFLYSGVVKSVQGDTCTVSVADMDITGVRLRASLADNQNYMIAVPAIGAVVVMGSVFGDLNDLVVLVCDAVQRIELHGDIIVNNGELGGMVKVEALTEALNTLIKAFNGHTHKVSTTGSATAQSGMAAAITDKADEVEQSDLENQKIKQ